jgi:ATP-dependent DNA helicase DinG
MTESAADVLVQRALEAFDEVVAQEGRFRHRPGQRHMAEAVARAFSEADVGDVPVPDDGQEPQPERRFSVIQAGTGVGKSLAYCAPAIALAQARNTRVLIATATVALQEQLVNKDLPALAALWPEPFRFALAKGRGRYVCRLKLERLTSGDAGAGADDPMSDLFVDEGLPLAESGPHALAAQLAYWHTLSQALISGTWDGDRDSLPTAPDPMQWQPIAAEASSCTAKHCPLFGQCGYFEQRKTLVGAHVIVANHDLLLSSLGSRSLPELDHCLLVLDEAHHLPAVALDQFTAQMDLTRLGWIDPLAQRAVHVGAALALVDALEAPKHAAALRTALLALARAVAEEVWADAPPPPPAHNARDNAHPGEPARLLRLPGGHLPDALPPLLEAVQATARLWLMQLAALAKALKTEIKDRPEDARRLSGLYAQMGTLAPKLEAVADTTEWLLAGLEANSVPVAKWFTRLPAPDGSWHLRVHACPTLPGTVLRQHLWPRVRAAVLTSATLTSCGRFDFFLSETGLNAQPETTSLEVLSPFDYPVQGCFEVALTRADPRDPGAFTTEMLGLLLTDLSTVRSGALVLCTSRDQLRQLVAALPPVLRERALVQGEWPRTVLLHRHKERVAQGKASIVMGLQSFGEGLDLPGDLCATLFITKLPFAPPDDPVGQARAEWLQAQGRNPFMELTVPATSVRLAQWAGRAIRTETDTAHIVCYDRRLVRTAYGEHLMQGLPPFARRVRPLS